MRLTTFATLAAASTVAFADTNTWSSWSSSSTPSSSQSVTTTVTLTLLHVSNQTVTSTSYSHYSTGTVPHVQANATSTFQPATMSSSTGSATIAAFSSGAAVAPQANIAVAGLLGLGAVAYAMY